MSAWLPDGAECWGDQPVARTVAGAMPRSRAVLAGTLRTVRSRRPPEPDGLRHPAGRRGPAGPWVEADLDDGTGVIGLRWLGRASVPGVVAGAGLVVEGTVLDDRGRLVLLNPLYRFAHSSRSW